MSGSGTGSGGLGGATPNGGCADIFIKTILSSPNPEVIGKLKKNDTLRLELQSETGPLLAFTNQGEVAGSVTSASLARIIRCIQDGYNFIAIVMNLIGGRCDVEVRPGD